MSSTPGPARNPILQVRDLTVAYRSGDRWLEALRDVSLTLHAGEVCGLAGESGSGKSTLAMAVMRYLPEAAAVCQGSIAFDGDELLSLGREAMRARWGRSMALVPQDPGSALNPSLGIGAQVLEVLQQHLGLGRARAESRLIELFDSVGLMDPRRVADSYPHQLSGGMQQRVLIAMALSTEPRLLLLDEPTSSLDVTTQARVLDLLPDLIRQRSTAVLHISHNLGALASTCDRVAVLYAGEMVEDAAVRDLFHHPLHPYTRGLLDCVPRLGEHKDEIRLHPIVGQIPSIDALPGGCVFRPRCPLAIPVCFEHPPLYPSGEDRRSRCHRWSEIAAGQVRATQPVPAPSEGWPRARGEAHGPMRGGANGEAVLEAVGVDVEYRLERSLIGRLRGRSGHTVRAVRDLSLAIGRGRTVGLVGESGSGKSSFARAVMGLVERTGGTISLIGSPLAGSLEQRSQATKRRLQMVFQSPEEALNPFHTVGDVLRRPQLHLLGVSREEADAGVREMLSQIGLSAEYTTRLPTQLSGGEKQRIAIARAFAPRPDLLVADEPISSLDVSVQASILDLLRRLSARYGTSTLFISHDLAVVGYLSDEILVLYLGHLMEWSAAGDTFDPPYHPYTEVLLSSIPLIDPDATQERVRLSGELPSALEEFSGCPFHTRCPRLLGPICAEQEPPWRIDERSGKRYYCHIAVGDLAAMQHRPFQFSALARGV